MPEECFRDVESCHVKQALRLQDCYDMIITPFREI
jgi:hypothetical protein